MLSQRDLFKVGFLQRCAREGLSAEEMLTRARRAREKLAGLADIVMTPYNAAVGLGSGALSTGINVGLAGSLIAPLALGGLGGTALAHALDADETDAKAVRQRDMVAQLRLLTQQLQQNTEIARKRKAQARPYNRM